MNARNGQIGLKLIFAPGPGKFPEEIITLD